MSTRTTKVTAAGGGTTSPVIAPDVPFSVGIRLAGGGSGKIQYTLSFKSEVTAGTAIWRDAAVGTVSADTDIEVRAPVTAVRGVSAVGAITLEIASRGLQ